MKVQWDKRGLIEVTGGKKCKGEYRGGVLKGGVLWVSAA